MTKLIHFVWIGDITQKVEDTIERYRQLNPDYEIRLHTDDSELLDIYRHNWDHYAPVPSMKSDLIRFSVLQKYGGWYFDIDCIPFVPLDIIIEEYQLDGTKLFLTRKGPFINGDILSIEPGFVGWPRINQYLQEKRYPNNGIEYYYLEYAYSLFYKCFINQIEYQQHLVLGEDYRFNYYPKTQPFILREHEIRKNNLEEELNTITLFNRFMSARDKWIKAGRPERTDEEVAHIYDAFCKPCKFLQNGSCKLCGCLINRERKYLNKLRWATEQCPHEPPFWKAEVQNE